MMTGPTPPVRPTSRAPSGPAFAGEGAIVSRSPRRSTARRRGGVAAVGVASLILTPLLAVTPAVAAPDGSDVVINELYARGGSSNQPHTHKFVHLHNPPDAPISLAGLGLQYQSASGTGARVVALTGSIPAEGYSLFGAGTNGTVGEALPAPDVSDTGLNFQGSN